MHVHLEEVIACRSLWWKRISMEIRGQGCNAKPRTRRCRNLTGAELFRDWSFPFNLKNCVLPFHGNSRKPVTDSLPTNFPAFSSYQRDPRPFRWLCYRTVFDDYFRSEISERVSIVVSRQIDHYFDTLRSLAMFKRVSKDFPKY